MKLPLYPSYHRINFPFPSSLSRRVAENSGVFNLALYFSAITDLFLFLLRSLISLATKETRHCSATFSRKPRYSFPPVLPVFASALCAVLSMLFWPRNHKALKLGGCCCQIVLVLLN
ncbi:uncharacterized protein LOC129305408 [Prosopis cineraria]|uniref:uncharacterized protein LOC129305408 n=1 Tax=Prosopis cineraria TaxID=364024 RepID=UPI00240F6AAE|nr:uncharacterized protein LOC129305408 [Prosopis cineraria]